MNIFLKSIISFAFIAGVAFSSAGAETYIDSPDQNNVPQKNSSGDKTVSIEKLIETSNSWDGSLLPSYPGTQPVVSIYKYTFPPKSVTNLHYHKIINCGVVLNGTLTVVSEDGSSRDFHAGEPIVETIGTVHHGENRGDTDVEVIMFYAGDGTTPLSFPIESKSNK